MGAAWPGGRMNGAEEGERGLPTSLVMALVLGLYL